MSHKLVMLARISKEVGGSLFIPRVGVIENWYRLFACPGRVGNRCGRYIDGE